MGRRGRRTGHDGGGDKPGWVGRKGDASIGIDSEEVLIVGPIDPALVEAVIQRHLPQIQACYERRLGARANLAGKIVVHFVIEADGRVSVSKTQSTTMGDPEVEDCVSDRFATFVFPHLKGGAGSVGINYPLLFKSSGG